MSSSMKLRRGGTCKWGEEKSIIIINIYLGSDKMATSALRREGDCLLSPFGSSSSSSSCSCH